MNKTLSTILTVLAVFALAAVIFFAGGMYARGYSVGPSMMYGWDNDNGYGPNRMGGNAYGPGGMMSDGGMMNGSNGKGSNMMGGYSYNPVNVSPLTIEQARTAAEKYLSNLNISGFEIAEIMIFDNNGYVIVEESGTGIGAFELLVDPVSQVAYPEHGPNMMWNLKYGGLNHEYMMAGTGHGMMKGMGVNGSMMQGWDEAGPADISPEMPVTPEQAVEYAQKYLDANIAGAATEHPTQFYGYYTLDFEKDGGIAGMLSVNGYSGQVFLHTWHGAFIEESEHE